MNQANFYFELKDIDTVAQQIIDKVNSKTLLFYGEMGSGKTTLISALLKVLKSEDLASSPTFSIVNEYQTHTDTIYHFDFYRVETIAETQDFGVEEYLTSGHWLFIEWPQLIEPLLENDANKISLTINEDGTRKLTLETT